MSLVPPVTNRFPPETSGEDMLLRVMGDAATNGPVEALILPIRLPENSVVPR